MLSADSPDFPKHRDLRIGCYSYVRNDGKVKKAERIFKIIEERDTEIDLQDEESTEQIDDSGILRSKDVNKYLYKTVYKKSQKLVKRTLDFPKLQSTCLQNKI